ncbi:MAG TPA: primosomal protein N' [Gemmatimonadales bacterium]|nr:primosomal protein N' [Gemmatimonadales bacterium]
MTEAPTFAQVALPLAVAEPYTYTVPDALADRVVAGARVVVPLRQREEVGIVVATGVAPPAQAAREILSVPDDRPALPAPLLDTVRWVSGYYGTPLGLTLKAAVPSALWGSSTVTVAIVPGAPRGGGTAGEVLQWLDRKGGRAEVGTIARHFKRPVWDVVNRLARVGSVELTVESPDTDAEAKTERVMVLKEAGLPLLERDRIFARAKEQRRLYETLEELGGRAAIPHLSTRLGFGASVLKGLLDKDLADVELEEKLRDPFGDDPGVAPPSVLTNDQQAALERLAHWPSGPGGAWRPALLHGVTGSGKTLVYLEAVRRTLADGRGAIILVPEIGLTPQTVRRVRGAFGDQVAVLHSGLSDGERADQWKLLRRGDRRVVVGARSAIFAPIDGVGIIVVDEEHEGSYKNGEAPRYHARDVAAVRARLEGATLVLGSATPSPETWQRAVAAEAIISLPERVGARPLPPVAVIDLRKAARVPETGAIPWSVALDEGIAATLARKEQALLLLNRRGFAAYQQCESCGAVEECPNCSIALTVHQTPPRLTCHYCAHSRPQPRACAACGHAVVQMRGIGTQQLEQLLAQRFPAARLARMDLDTTSTKWSHHRILGAVERGEVDILLGTQMIAKGLDFPNVTLVGVVDADTGLHLPDFRAAERTFQLLAQVAGRAGRGPKGGKVLVQTRTPEHHAIQYASRHDLVGFLAEELKLREAPTYPPHVALANLLVTGEAEEEVSAAALRLADWCHALVERTSLPLDILGPAPAALARIKERWRWHVVVRGSSDDVGRFVRYAAPRVGKGSRAVRVSIDRDPVSLL